jgi:hypothetical protein
MTAVGTPTNVRLMCAFRELTGANYSQLDSLRSTAEQGSRPRGIYSDSPELLTLADYGSEGWGFESLRARWTISQLRAGPDGPAHLVPGYTRRP